MHLLDLPLLVLEEIVSHIPYDDRKTLVKLLRTSRALYHLSAPRLYHTLHLVASGETLVNREVLQSPGWRWWARKIVIADAPESCPELENEEQDGWAEVAKVIDGIEVGQLREFKFISRMSAPVQATLSSAISKHSLRTLKLTMHQASVRLRRYIHHAYAADPANPAHLAHILDVNHIQQTPHARGSGLRPTTGPLLTSLTPTRHSTLQKLSINHVDPKDEAELISMYTTLKNIPLTALSLKSRVFDDLEYVPLPEIHSRTRLRSIKLYGFDIPPAECCAMSFFNPAHLRKLVLWECRGFDKLLRYLSTRLGDNDRTLETLSLYTWEDTANVDGTIAFIAACRGLKSVFLDLSSFSVAYMKSLIGALESSKHSIISLKVQVREPITTQARFYKPEWLAALSGFTALENLAMNYDVKGIQFSSTAPTIPPGLKTLDIRLGSEIMVRDAEKRDVPAVIARAREFSEERPCLEKLVITDGSTLDTCYELRIKRWEDKVSIEQVTD